MRNVFLLIIFLVFSIHAEIYFDKQRKDGEIEEVMAYIKTIGVNVIVGIILLLLK